MNASIVSSSKGIIQPRNKLTRAYLLDFLSLGQIDWLDESQAFIPYTAWFETGRKSIVDFPKKDITNFPDHTIAPSYSSLQIGEEYCFFFRVLDYYYHGAVITFRPAMWSLMRNYDSKLMLYRKRTMPLFRRTKHRRPKGFIYMINGRISFRKKKAYDLESFRRKYTKRKRRKVRFFLKKKRRRLKRRIKPLPTYLQPLAFQKKTRLCTYKLRKRLRDGRERVSMEAIFQQRLYIRLRKNIRRITQKSRKSADLNDLSSRRKIIVKPASPERKEHKHRGRSSFASFSPKRVPLVDLKERPQKRDSSKSRRFLGTPSRMK